MHAWYHQKDYLILFKMISYLLWLCHRGKGSISKYGIRSQLKSCKMNTSGHEESIKNMFLWVEYVFCSQLVSSSTAWRCGARRWCRHLGRPPDTQPWSCYWNQWTLMKSKIPVTISIQIHHGNQAPATSFVSLLWLMWFFEIKWFESSF